MTILEAIKKIVFSNKMEFAMYSLVDGTQVEVDGELAPGTMVYVVDAETGERKSAPAGEHALTEPANTTIVVDEQGLITDVKETDAPTAAIEEEAMSETAAAEVGSVREEIVEEVKEEIAEEGGISSGEAQAIIEQVISVVEDKVASVTASELDEMKKKMDELSKLVLKMAKTQEAFNKDVDALKKSPSGTPLSKTAFGGVDTPVNVNEARMQFIKSLKNK
jgi:hypothetical protein